MLADEVQVWRARLDQLADCSDELFRLLSEDERARAALIRFHRQRDEYCLTRGFLRRLLASLGAGEPSEIAFVYSPRGKPRLAPGQRRQELEFSVSHTPGTVVFAIAESRSIGIDVEQVRAIERMDSIVSEFFAAEEKEEYESLPPADRERAFFNGWTRKEAYSKALGDGLSCAWDSFAVTLSPGVPARFRRIGAELSAADRWQLADLTDDPAYVVALAAPGAALHVRSQVWSP